MAGERNLFGQEQWARRGENDARIRALEVSRTTDEATLALLPRGRLGHTAVVVTQTGITTLTDLTNAVVAVTVAPSRWIKITGYVCQFTRTAGTVTYTDLRIYEGATPLGLVTFAIPNTYGGGLVIALVSPTPGEHTYKLRCQTDGTVTAENATAPAYILVEDIGAT